MKTLSTFTPAVAGSLALGAGPVAAPVAVPVAVPVAAPFAAQADPLPAPTRPSKTPRRPGIAWRAGLLAACLAAASVNVQAQWSRDSGSAETGAKVGVDVGGNSAFTRLVPAESLEQSAAQQYAEMLRAAAAQKALAGPDHPQLKRLRAIAQRIVVHAEPWNPRVRQWKWEVNLIGSRQINAFCMPGGKIAFYTGILDQLKLTDDEVAMVMGHEIAHALREHARERMGKNAATGIGANLLSQVLGLGQVGQTLTHYGAQLLTLEFSRSDEREADLVGMELAARAGFNPRAGVSLWQKMTAAQKNAPPQWLSTHPSGQSRISEIEANLPKVLPLYERARKG